MHLEAKSGCSQRLVLNSYEGFFQKYFELLDKPSNMIDKLKLLPRLAEIAQMMPKTVKTGPCKEVIIKDNPSLIFFQQSNAGLKMADVTLRCRLFLQ